MPLVTPSRPSLVRARNWSLCQQAGPGSASGTVHTSSHWSLLSNTDLSLVAATISCPLIGASLVFIFVSTSTKLAFPNSN